MAEAATSSKGGAGFKLAAVVTRSLREGALVVFGALALVLLLALASFDPADRSFTYTGDPGRVANLMGPIGAWISDLFLVLFGAPAFLFPVMVAVSGWVLFRPPAAAAPSRASLAFRLAGFVLTLATSAGIATLHFSTTRYPQTAGGILGDLVGHGLARGFSFLGATLLLLGLWFAGVSLFAGVSWLKVMDLLGKGLLGGSSWMRSFLASRREKSAGRENRAARQEAAREDKKKTEYRPPPGSSRRSRSSRRASGSRRSARWCCSSAPPRRNSPRSSSSTMRRRARSAIPPRRSRRCRAWSN